jgi:hypothetical protein
VPLSRGVGSLINYGKKSRSPKTPETREKSSRNALRHGFATRHTVVLECECPEEFEEMIDKLTRIPKV